MYKKITGSTVAFLSLIAFTDAHASQNTERTQGTVPGMSQQGVGNTYKPVSPFSVDREKSSVRNGDVISYAHRNQMVLRKEGLLSKELESWVNQGGYTLLWNSNRDYIIYNTITLHADSFDNVLNELGKLFDSENYGLVIKQYEVNKVIIIDAR